MMNPHRLKLKQYCAQHKRKNTLEREEVLSVIEHLAGRAFHADDITEEARNRDYFFSRATIYRTLELFEKAEIIKRSTKHKGKQLYRLYRSAKEESYFKCTQCGRKIKLNSSALQQVIYSLTASCGSSLFAETICISGCCDTCRKANNSGPPSGQG